MKTPTHSSVTFDKQLVQNTGVYDSVAVRIPDCQPSSISLQDQVRFLLHIHVCAPRKLITSLALQCTLYMHVGGKMKQRRELLATCPGQENEAAITLYLRAANQTVLLFYPLNTKAKRKRIKGTRLSRPKNGSTEPRQQRHVVWFRQHKENYALFHNSYNLQRKEQKRKITLTFTTDTVSLALNLRLLPMRRSSFRSSSSKLYATLNTHQRNYSD